MTTIFMVYPRSSTTQGCKPLYPGAKSGYLSELNWNSRDACPDSGARTIRATTYAAVFARFMRCTRDHPLPGAAGVFCRPSETTGRRLVVSELVTLSAPSRTLHRRPSHLTTASIMLAHDAATEPPCADPYARCRGRESREASPIPISPVDCIV